MATFTPCTATALRRDLNARAAGYARRHGLLHDATTGRDPSVIFGEDEQGRHGNFHPASYRAIVADESWRARLDKAHTAGRRAAPRADWRWRELDCAGSSDALLMNIFCYPRLHGPGSRVASLLGVCPGKRPSFGVLPRLNRERGLVDTTEIDMELDGLLVEAKLTEGDFQTARPALLDRFVGWRAVLDEDALPRSASGGFESYQLLRGVLAAQSSGQAFCVLLDARRVDLMERWYAVLRAVPQAELRCRLKLVTWQELAGSLPVALRRFLDEKYGIAPA